MWEEKDKKLSKKFEFNNFVECINFVQKVGELAEKANHHPDISIHNYRFVTITTTTHDKGEVTQKDHTLADKIDMI